MGFDYFYGFVGGEIDQYQPMLWEQTTPVTPYLDHPDYTLNADLADKAIAWIRNVTTVAPDKPYFCLLLPRRHPRPAPRPGGVERHVQGPVRRRLRGVSGEDLRPPEGARRHPAGRQLTKRPDEIPAWDTFTPDQQKMMARQMEVFAGFTAQVDHEIGRLIDYVRSLPGGENTLIFYEIGDNGGSAEGGLTGTIDDYTFFNGLPADDAYGEAHLAEWGGPTTSPHFAVGWAWAMNTPFQWTKQIASHFGGTRNPLIVSWPAGISQRRARCAPSSTTSSTSRRRSWRWPASPSRRSSTGLRRNRSRASAWPTPSTTPRPRAGAPSSTSRCWSTAASTTTAGSPARNRSCPGRSATRRSPAASTPRPRPGSCTTSTQDFSQAVDLAQQEPAKLKELQDLLWGLYARYDVLPLQWDSAQRQAGQGPFARPSYNAGQTTVTYYPGMIRMQESVAPSTYNRSFRITAEVDVPAGGAEGALIALGGVEGGWSLAVQDQDILVFHYNNLIANQYRIAASSPIPVGGKATLVADFAYDGGGLGKGATVTLSANGTTIGEGRIDKTVPVVYGTDGFDIGGDYGSPVSPDYMAPFVFTGTLEQVTIDLL